MKTRHGWAAVLTAAMFAVPASAVLTASSADAASKPAWTKNCTELHKKYAHGVGKKNAKDKTSGKPVTNFKKSDSIFKTAMDNNKGLDRDKDNIACEKA